MLLRALQRLVRLAPGPAQHLWGLVPHALRHAAGPFIHPIAAGKRGGNLLIEVPDGLPPRSFDVVHRALGTEDALPRDVRDAAHRVFEVGAGRRLDELARENSILDAVYVASRDDADVPLARRLGWRVVSLEEVRSRGRADEARDFMSFAFPTVSVVVVTQSNASLCRSCLDALVRNSPWPNLDVVVIDNGSSDGTRPMLEAAAARNGRIRVIHNDENRGFASAANQGVRATRGEFVVLLNDDALVAPGWLSRLVSRFECNERFGLVCPVTNEANTSARVAVDYRDLAGMERFAARRAFDYLGAWRETDVVSLFCAVTRRTILENVGLLDERFAVGMFEDDDLSFCLKKRGFDLGIALDAFVHHVGQASFSRLRDSEYLAVWEANRRRFEEKWGVRWHPPERETV